MTGESTLPRLHQINMSRLDTNQPILTSGLFLYAFSYAFNRRFWDGIICCMKIINWIAVFIIIVVTFVAVVVSRVLR